MTKILAIDLGTTFFKLTLFDRTGRLCESHRIAPPVVRPKTGWMELPAAAMEEAIAGGIRELGNCPGGGLADVEAVTFATQTNSFVLLGEDGRPLTPVILWPDARGAELEVELQEQYAAAEAGAITGIPQLGCQFMVAKLLWLRQHRPEIWRRMDRIALMSDYLTLLLTGEHVTEAGAAGLTGLVDIHRCRWSTEMPRSVWVGRTPPVGNRTRGNRPRADPPLGRRSFWTAEIVPVHRRLSGSIRRSHRRGERRAGNDLGDHRDGVGHGSLCRSVLRAAWPRRVSGACLSRRTLLADGLRRRLGELLAVVSGPIVGPTGV